MKLINEAILLFIIFYAKGTGNQDLDPVCLYPVCVTLEIENTKDVALTDPSFFMHRGILSTSMKPIKPHSAAELFMRKTGWSSTGADGVFVYTLEGRQIIIFISAPYDFRIHANWIGIAITKKGYQYQAKEHFKTLRNDEINPEEAFDAWSIERYPSTTKILTAQTDDFTVTASMGSDHITKAKIKIF